jgi:O-antigen/teichoic acid export membrane protein
MQNQTLFVFKQSFIYGIGNTILKLSGLIILPLYLNFINKEELGAVMLFETIFQFVLILSGWGVKGGFMRWYNEMQSRDEKRKLFFTTWFFNSITSFLSVAVTGTFVFYFSNAIFNYHISQSTLLFFLTGTFFRLLLDIPYYFLKLEQKAMAQTGWAVLNIFLLIGFTYWYLKMGSLGFEGIYKAQMAAHLITFVMMVPFMIKHIKPKFKHGVLKEMIQYGFPLAISSILTTVLTLSDRHIINQYHNLAEVGGYGMAFKIANLVQMVIVASLLTSYSNYFFKTLHQKDSMTFFLKFLKLFFVLLIFGGLGIVLFAPEAMFLISYGNAFYQASVVLVPVLIAGLIFSGMRQLFTLPLNKHKRTRVISLILILTAVVNIIGNFILVPSFGTMGASISTVFAQLFGMVWFVIEARKVEKIDLPIVKSGILFIIWCGACIVGLHFFQLPMLVGWLVKGLLLMFFIAMLFVVGLLNREDWNVIKSNLKLVR